MIRYNIPTNFDPSQLETAKPGILSMRAVSGGKLDINLGDEELTQSELDTYIFTSQKVTDNQTCVDGKLDADYRAALTAMVAKDGYISLTGQHKTDFDKYMAAVAICYP